MVTLSYYLSIIVLRMLRLLLASILSNRSISLATLGFMNWRRYSNSYKPSWSLFSYITTFSRCVMFSSCMIYCVWIKFYFSNLDVMMMNFLIDFSYMVIVKIIRGLLIYLNLIISHPIALHFIDFSDSLSDEIIFPTLTYLLLPTLFLVLGHVPTYVTVFTCTFYYIYKELACFSFYQSLS